MRGALLTKYLGIVVLTGIVVAVAFGSSIDHEFVTWDDTILITENPIVQTPSLKNVVKAFTSYDPELYIPLTFVSYQINSVVCGLSPSCFHATDLVLHTLNAVLVYALFASFIGSDLIALVLALLFAVHPLNTEAVVWASARKDTLSTLFFLSSLLAYIQTRSAGKRIDGFSLRSFSSCWASSRKSASSCSPSCFSSSMFWSRGVIIGR